MRRIFAAYLLLVFTLSFAEQWIGPGFFGVAMEFKGAQDWPQSRLKAKGLNYEVELLPEAAGRDWARFRLRNRSLSSLQLRLAPPVAAGGVEASFGGLNLRFPPGGGELDLAPLLAPQKRRIPLLGTFYFFYDGSFGAQRLLWILSFATLILWAAFAPRLLPGSSSPADASLRPSDAWICAAALLGALALLEIRLPHYFVQLDNYKQFFPKLLNGFRQILEGRFPFYDPYQRFGAPLFDVGTYSFFYPLMFLSWLLSLGLSGGPLWTLDLHAMLCLSLGTGLMGLALSRAGCNRALGMAAALGWGSLGFFCKGLANWYYIGPTVLHLPLGLIFLLQARRGQAGWTWWAASATARAAYFYGGNAQLWFYACLIEMSAVLYLAWLEKNAGLVRAYARSGLLTLGLIAPLLLMQAQLAALAERGISAINGGGLSFDSIPGMLFPWPMDARYPSDTLPIAGAFAGFYHVGAFWILGFLALLGAWLRKKQGWGAPLLLLAALVGALSFGRSAVLPVLVPKLIPTLGKLRYSFKLLPFFAFLIMLELPLAFSRLAWTALARRLLLALSLATAALALISVAWLSRPLRVDFQLEPPYPALHPLIAAHSGPSDLFMSLVQPEPYHHPHVSLLPQAYASLYQLQSVEENDPFHVSEYKAPRAGDDLALHCKRWGISRVIYQKALLRDAEALGMRFHWEHELVPLARKIPHWKILGEADGFVLYDTGVAASGRRLELTRRPQRLMAGLWTGLILSLLALLWQWRAKASLWRPLSLF